MKRRFVQQYKGPLDLDLVRMLEAEVVERSPNVTWESIAGLQSEKLVKLLFEMARFYAPSTVFLDEIDALGGQRSAAGENDATLRVKSELLIQMDGLGSSGDGGNVTVLGATNLPWNLDEALRRRFEKRIYIPLPDEKQREELFRINLRDSKLDASVNIQELAKKTEVDVGRGGEA